VVATAAGVPAGAARAAAGAAVRAAVATRRTPDVGQAAVVENPVAVTAVVAAVRRTPGAGPVAAGNPAGAAGAARASSVVPSAYAAV
jgi:hypothetical protein